MTTNRDPDRLLRAFLREGEEELHYQVYDAVRAQIERKRQRAVFGPWRTAAMNKFLPIGLGAAAVVVLLIVGARFLGTPGSPNVGGPGVEPTATPEASVTEPSPSGAADSPEGQHLLLESAESGVPITINIAAPDWEGEPGGGVLCWGDAAGRCAGPPEGAGVIAFDDGDYYVYGHACDWSNMRPDTPATTVDDLLEALSNQGSREASAPEDITVDGYAGKKIILRMDAGYLAGEYDIDDCDEGNFALFGVPGDDPARYSQGPGQIEEVWAVDVDGRIVVVIGSYYEQTPQHAVDELRAILESMKFK